MLALVGITCTEPTFTGPDGTGMAALNFSTFASHAGGVPVPVDSLEVKLQRPADESLAFDSVFPASNATKGDSAVITFHVLLRQSSEDFLLSIRALGGGITWYTASSPIRISAGAKATPTAFVVRYVGPGANAARIAIAPTDTMVVGGIPFALRAVVFDSGQTPITGVPVGYRVSDPSLASITQLTPQIATFTGKPGVRDSVWVVGETPTHLKDSTRVYIVPTIPVGTVTISPKFGVTIANGDSLQYTAVAKDLSGSILVTPLTWTSTDPAVATVSGAGLATARGGDSTMIIVSAGGVADTAWLVVRALQSITLSPEDTIITAVGEVVDLQASVVYNLGTVVTDFGRLKVPGAGKSRVIAIGGSNIRFASASPSVATVDRVTGQVRIIGRGDAVIVAHDSVASSDSLIRGFATLHVNQVTAGIYNSPKSPVTIGIGGKAQLTATAVDANGYPIAGKTFLWVAQPDDTTGGQIVSVTSTGLVTGVAVGTTYVFASLVEVPSAFQDSTVVVVSGTPPTELRWAFDSVTVGKGGTIWVSLSMSTPATRDLNIDIRSDDDRIAQARSTTVTIPMGMTTTSVEIEGLAIGRTLLTAKDAGGPGPSYDDAEMAVEVVSTDMPSLYLNSDISVSTTKPAQTFVAIPFPAPADVTVTLSALLLDVPKTVTIRKGTDRAYFDVTGLLLGIGVLNASAPGYRDAATVTLQIQLLGSF